MVWPTLLGAGIGALGAGLSSASADKSREQTAALTREMAQNSIRWRVNDAKKAGVHPLFALGSGSSISPTLPAGGDVSGLNQAAASISNIGKNNHQKALAAAQIALLEAQTQKTTIEGQNLARQGPRPDVLSEIDPTPYINRANRRHVATISDIERKTGVAYQAKPGMIRLTLPGGKSILVPNQEYLEPGEIVGAGVAAAYGDIGKRTWRSKYPFLREYQLPSRIKKRKPHKSSGAYYGTIRRK